MAFLAVLVAAAVAAVSAQELPECRHTFPDGNSFDLTGLRKPPMCVCLWKRAFPKDRNRQRTGQELTHVHAHTRTRAHTHTHTHRTHTNNTAHTQIHAHTQIPHRQRDWYADDRKGNMYYFNMW